MVGVNANELEPIQIFRPNDIYIAVMGVTGSGKSTFISKLCPGAVVGHGLTSQTKEIQDFIHVHKGKTVHLIDTPGFDDTFRSDSDVLRDVAYYMAKSYGVTKIRLTGILYVHPVTSNRMSGAAFKNLRTFRKLCGKESMDSVVLVTTMWDIMSPHELGVERMKELVDTPDFWGNMTKEGSEVREHQNTVESAAAIIDYLVTRNKTTVLGLQREMVDLHRSLEKTEAGKELDSDMLQQRKAFEKRSKDTMHDLEEALAAKDPVSIEAIREEQTIMKAKISEIQMQRDILRVGVENLIVEREKLMAEAEAAARARLEEEMRAHHEYEVRKLDEAALLSEMRIKQQTLRDAWLEAQEVSGEHPSYGDVPRSRPRARPGRVTSAAMGEAAAAGLCTVM